jgi:threonine dehydrogenase-like Zn-dependent dehydrogenase
MFGGFAGGQAEYVRVPFADVGPLKIEDGLEDRRRIGRAMGTRERHHE